MAHKCPRCGEPVDRGSSSSAQRVAAGLIGTMFYAVFGAFECKKCGKIVRNKFPPEVRKKMDGVTFLLIGAVAIAIGAILLLLSM